MMEQRLQSGLAALNLPVEGIPALVRYGDLLIETNKVMNLTAITDPEDVATLHFLDSAALLTLESFSGKSVVDVGTGAGFPGLPLRVLEPSIRLTLLAAVITGGRLQKLEHNDQRWITAAELPQYEFSPADRAFLPALGVM